MAELLDLVEDDRLRVGVQDFPPAPELVVVDEEDVGALLGLHEPAEPRELVGRALGDRVHGELWGELPELVLPLLREMRERDDDRGAGLRRADGGDRRDGLSEADVVAHEEPAAGEEKLGFPRLIRARRQRKAEGLGLIVRVEDLLEAQDLIPVRDGAAVEGDAAARVDRERVALGEPLEVPAGLWIVHHPDHAGLLRIDAAEDPLQPEEEMRLAGHFPRLAGVAEAERPVRAHQKAPLQRETTRIGLPCSARGTDVRRERPVRRREVPDLRWTARTAAAAASPPRGCRPPSARAR
jgi:hypothetical protein